MSASFHSSTFKSLKAMHYTSQHSLTQSPDKEAAREKLHEWYKTVSGNSAPAVRNIVLICLELEDITIIIKVAP